MPCPNPAAYSFTLPGQPNGCVCSGHLNDLHTFADALGLKLTLVRLSPAEPVPACEFSEDDELARQRAAADGLRNFASG